MAKVDPRYLDGTYESTNPDWHEADAGWKAAHALSLLERNHLRPGSVCDIGCGTGGVIKALAASPGIEATAVGFDVSEHIVEMAEASASPGVSFKVWPGPDTEERFDVALVMDVVEHVPDYLGFLEEIAGIAERHIFHLPLDMNAQGVARMAPLMHARRSVGHLHYFSRETAIASLEYAGYEIRDWKFTPSYETLAGKSGRRRAFDSVRSGLFRINPERTVDVLGGYSLMVLTTRP